MYQSRIHNAKSRSDRDSKNRPLELPDDGQEYGYVVKMLGNGRVQVLCADGKERMGRICGSIRKYHKKVLIETGNLILISHRGFEDKVDILDKYSYEESVKLMKYDDFPKKIKKMLNRQEGFDDTKDVNEDDDSDDSIAFEDI